MFELQVNKNYGHLWQVFTGFNLILNKRENPEIKIRTPKIKEINNIDKPICIVKLNDTIFAYDTLDGYNFLDHENLEENLIYFDKILNQVDVYFKRSYSAKMNERLLNKNKVYPLGLNYPQVDDSLLIQKSIQSFSENILAQLKKYAKPVTFVPSYSIFEQYPTLTDNPTILFNTRLWETNSKNNEYNRQRAEINRTRIECIRACQKVFKDRFFGGIQDSQLARNMAADLIMPSSVSSKKNYYKRMKQTEICVATTGLHNSIGFKMAEYVASSRAIVSEELNYEVPYGFRRDKNYLEFKDSKSMVACIQNLLEDKSKILDMMVHNYNYYNSYLKPDSFILNSLFTAGKAVGKSLVSF